MIVFQARLLAGSFFRRMALAIWMVVCAAAAGADTGSFLNNFADLELNDQSGRAFAVSELNDRIVLFSFIYTRCGSTCPVQTRALAQVQGQLPADVRARVRFVSISVDPDGDTPQQLQLFARQMQVDLHGWSFLTGPVPNIRRLAERLDLFASGAGRPALHRTDLWLVDRGRLLQRYAGEAPDARRLLDELTRLSRLNIAAPSTP